MRIWEATAWSPEEVPVLQKIKAENKKAVKITCLEQVFFWPPKHFCRSTVQKWRCLSKYLHTSPNYHGGWQNVMKAVSAIRCVWIQFNVVWTDFIQDFSFSYSVLFSLSEDQSQKEGYALKVALAQLCPVS